MTDTIQNLILIIILMFFMWVPSKHALHMFQQNRYELGRYYKWMKEHLFDNIMKFVAYAVGLIVIFILSFFIDSLIVKYILCAYVLIWAIYSFINEKKKAYIKPLVYTGRVKRQIVVLVILELASVIAVLLIVNNTQVFVAKFLGFYFISWLLIYLVGIITAPIEKAFRNHYKKLAKDILQSRPDLIKIGITGSYGKTSSKNILQAILSEKYLSLMTPASYNTPMGITITIRTMLKPIHQVFICEMGADHVGDISELCAFVEPKLGIVTSIGPQHLNTFKSQENIIKEKMQLIESLPCDGVGIINLDNEFIRGYQVQNKCRLVTYAIHQDADYKADNIVYDNTGSNFNVINEGQAYAMHTKLLGEHNVANILAAIAVARDLDISWEEIQSAVKKISYIEHRLEPKVINGYHFIDDAFNANPSGSSMALEVLKTMKGKRIIVTPGMIDLGSKQEEINREFGKKINGCADVVILVGKNQTKPIREGLLQSGYNMDNVTTVDNVKEAFALVYQNYSSDDTILLENDLPDAFKH